LTHGTIEQEEGIGSQVKKPPLIYYIQHKENSKYKFKNTTKQKPTPFPVQAGKTVDDDEIYGKRRHCSQQVRCQRDPVRESTRYTCSLFP
jgi:hypothetical protein